MAKDDLIELTGTVTEVLPGSMYRIKLDDNDSVLTCYTGGKLKQHKIKIILGDRVKIEVSMYDLTKGRVTYRL
jgi:translation initiation factor IF-1